MTVAHGGALHRPSGSSATGAWSVAIDPEGAGWGFTGLRVATLGAGGSISFETGEDEAIVVPLAGEFSVTTADGSYDLAGRPSPFAGPTDVAYLPRDEAVEVTAPSGGRFAVATARASRRLAAQYLPAHAVPVELRGAGACSREVRNFGMPGSLDADRIIAVEVVTPGGNWSSYPPHKHDEASPTESVLEEIYYYEIEAGPAGPGIAYQRVYGTTDRPIELLAEVRDGDLILVPHGWHGPAMAVPGYDLYYLNVMAGPGAERAWKARDDPAHAWIRDAWRGQAVDPRLPVSRHGGRRPMTVVRLTVGQAIVRFLVAQHTERDGAEHRLIEGMFGILGHGNVAGLGAAVLESELADPRAMPYHQGRNEQGMVHVATAFARQRNRLSTLACLTSVGPGATNMVTGAATATINRLPVLLLPSDVFATRVADPVLQQLEHPIAGDVSVNDAFRPVARYFDRVWRPEQLPSALLGAMRVLADPAETGAVVIALPEDVQVEAWEWPEELFARRVWHVPRPAPDRDALGRAVASIRASRRPLIVSGGGTIYSEATEALRAFVETTGIPVAETFAGKGSLAYDHPSAVGAVGATGTSAANALAREADLVIGIGTRYSDFTTASRTAFQHPDVRFVNINIASFDAAKLSAIGLRADARATLEALSAELAGWSVDPGYRDRATALARDWDATVSAAYALRHGPLPAQTAVIGAVNDAVAPPDVVVCAAGSLPGDLHKLWRTRDPKGFHVEYGFSCMGYEVAGGIGVKMAAPERDVFVLVGDGSWLMLSSELVTAVQEHVPIIVVLIQNHGYQSIGALSASVGAQRFGTRYRFRGASGRLDGDVLPVDLAANAESLGARVIRTATVDELRTALVALKREHRTGPVVIHIETDPLVPAPDGGGWWDVPIAETSELPSVDDARESYRSAKQGQRPLAAPPD